MQVVPGPYEATRGSAAAPGLPPTPNSKNEKKLQAIARIVGRRSFTEMGEMKGISFFKYYETPKLKDGFYKLEVPDKIKKFGYEKRKAARIVE